MVCGDAVAVEVILQVGLGPGVEGCIFCGRGGGGEVRGYRGVAGTAGFGGAGVGVLGGLEEFVTGGAGFLGDFLVLRGQVVSGIWSVFAPFVVLVETYLRLSTVHVSKVQAE